MEIQSLLIEVTRKCNMACNHCLRGEQENKDVSYMDIGLLLDQLTYIGQVTFTGGEPSLNVSAIEFFLTEVKRRDIRIGFFYIATNGKKISVDFVMVCLKLYSYCDEKDMCTVHVSNDIYHQNEGSYNTELLDGLSFFRRKYEEEGKYLNGYLINEGNALLNGIGTRNLRNTLKDIKTREDFQNTEIYLNCNGEIVVGCDWSYESQNDNVFCKVDELESKYLELSE